MGELKIASLPFLLLEVFHQWNRITGYNHSQLMVCMRFSCTKMAFLVPHRKLPSTDHSGGQFLCRVSDKGLLALAGDARD